MRAVLQRVSRASVSVDGKTVGSIGKGILVLVGFSSDDGPDETQWMADKIVGLRIFPDDDGCMNRDVRETGGSVLVVSQFTLYADARKGRRPSFVGAAQPEQAEVNYNRFIGELGELDIAVATGEFGALMEVDLLNDGPVTLILDR
jgi:D-tyrosyl-tRNA(Tyr) deacylase